MSVLRFVLGDQPSFDLSSLADHDRDRDVVLMVEVAEEATYVRHHKKKLAFVLAAMRHHAQALRAAGYRVDYVTLDDPDNLQGFTAELMRAVERHGASRVVVTEPSEWRVLQMMRDWETLIGVPVDIREDGRFLCSHARFQAWAQGRRQPRMEFFYREMRRVTGWLMDGDAPVGGQWNFDVENRAPWPAARAAPERRSFAPDATTRAAMALVEARFPDHFGDLEPFWLAVTRDDALTALDHFIAVGLPEFGRFQDAMVTGAPFLHHALIAPYLNIGLLDPREVCLAALEAYRRGHAPLASVEGFVRQILGWREYVRGLYWLTMPDYAGTNALGATRTLPAFYWTGETDMNCLRQCIADTRRHAYAHHIQRLMVTGNFALLAGIAPAEVEAWYLLVYADAYDWVELPNTHGMALFADGGVLASKPYAASGAYIDRMSDYCADCRFDPVVKLGPGACPFNLLYWDFLARNAAVLGRNPRLAMPYQTLARMPAERLAAIRAEAQAFLDGEAMAG